jgi:hypothetical protein
MSGIAGILRRDGGPVPEKWSKILEESILLGRGMTFRFEDSIPINNGNLNILLLSGSSKTKSDSDAKDPMVVDGNIDVDGAFAVWKEETLELELGRIGTGQKSLYWFDLAEVGDGLLFCTNPLPLLKIVNELELSKGITSQGIQDYLRHGFITEGGELLSPIYSMPIQSNSHHPEPRTSELDCNISPTPAEDVQTLVRILGTPFSDYGLLSTIQQYRYAKEIDCSVYDGLVNPQAIGVLNRIIPTTQEEKLLRIKRNVAKRIELGAIAGYVEVDLSISTESERIKPLLLPIDSWLRSSQSSLGQLAGDTLNSPNPFVDLPIDEKKCLQMFDNHRSKQADYSKELFSFLTLALWRQLLHA